MNLPSPNRRDRPRVTIALPVFNGEDYLEQAIGSLLSQTYADFELILCDNASTDRTAEICQAFLEQDPRVSYYRNASNTGSAENFNRAVGLAKGDYFKWAAHDDICGPQFIERCVQVLDENPDVVLAYPKAHIIDCDSRKQEVYPLTLATGSASPVVRFNELLKGHRCYEIFGLIRMSALLETGLIGPYSHGDGVLLVELAFRGRFHEVPELLFFPRAHANQSMTMLNDRRKYSVWFDTALKDAMLFPHWRILVEYLKRIHQAPIPLSGKFKAYRHLVRWMRRKRRKLSSDITYHLRKSTQRLHLFRANP